MVDAIPPASHGAALKGRQLVGELRMVDQVDQLRIHQRMLGARVHGAFGSFSLGIKIGLDAVNRLNAKPRELTILYYDSDASPCACFADGTAVATYASVGQRTLTIAPERAPPGMAAVIVIRPRQGGAGLKYAIPMSGLAKLGPMNKDVDPRGRYDAVMATEGLFQVDAAP